MNLYCCSVVSPAVFVSHFWTCKVRLRSAREIAKWGISTSHYKPEWEEAEHILAQSSSEGNSSLWTSGRLNCPVLWVSFFNFFFFKAEVTQWVLEWIMFAVSSLWYFCCSSKTPMLRPQYGADTRVMWGMLGRSNPNKQANSDCQYKNSWVWNKMCALWLCWNTLRSL